MAHDRTRSLDKETMNMLRVMIAKALRLVRIFSKSQSQRVRHPSLNKTLPKETHYGHRKAWIPRKGWAKVTSSLLGCPVFTRTFLFFDVVSKCIKFWGHPIASSKRTPGVRTGFQVVFLRPRRSNTWDLFTGTLAILDLLPQRSQMVPDV
jgi:hypothetical protein